MAATVIVLRAENIRLRADNEELRAHLASLQVVVEELRRAGKRQSAPFSKRAPKQDPARSGRKAGLGPDDIVLVDDDAIRAAMRALFQHASLVVEPGGAAGLAALLSGAIRVGRDERVGVVITGGNVSPAKYCALVGG